MKTTGPGCNKSFKRLLNLFKMKPVLIYWHRNNKYTMTITNQNQKMIKDQVWELKYTNFKTDPNKSKNT